MKNINTNKMAPPMMMIFSFDIFVHSEEDEELEEEAPRRGGSTMRGNFRNRFDPVRNGKGEGSEDALEARPRFPCGVMSSAWGFGDKDLTTFFN
jgi:hypothetical protein